MRAGLLAILIALLAFGSATAAAAPADVALEFDTAIPATVLDRDGEGTGFAQVIPNAAGDQYQPSKIDLQAAGGRLVLTAQPGSNTTANTLKNQLDVTFDATGTRTIATRLLGTSTIATPTQQGGVIFGPSQDDYVKLVAIATTSGPRIQFYREIGGSSRAQIGALAVFTPAQWAAIATLDLFMHVDPDSGVVSAQYAVNGGQPLTITTSSGATATYTIPVASRPAFFNADSHASLAAMTSGGPETPIAFDWFRAGVCVVTGGSPSIASVTPPNGATGVARDGAITAEVTLPNCGGIDTSTLDANARLVDTTTGTTVPTNVNTSGGGDVIVVQPMATLSANRLYRFEVASGLRDESGAAFTPFQSTYTTGVASLPTGNGDFAGGFTRVATSAPELAGGVGYTTVLVGPDDKLYAAANTGEIRRFPINPDGSLGAVETITTIPDVESGPRLVIGMAFDPASTAANPILWVTHNEFVFSDAPEFTGKIGRLSGPGLASYQDVVVGLPRSIRDHLTNSLAFKSGKLYLTQGSNSAMGAPDNAWGQRPERQLNAAVLELDRALLPGTLPIDVRTLDGGGSYDPFASGAPLTLFASGLRNAYDLVWHTNGRLYVPTNGSASGGNTPATPSPLPAECANRIDDAANGNYTGPVVPGLTNVSAQPDYLFRVVEGGYYGHPNPARCEWVANGGDPAAGVDPFEVPQYPNGTLPDRNYRGASFTFGQHFSPNGVVEYRSNAFGGDLQGTLLVARFSAGDDVILLTPGGTDGDINESQTAVPGLTGFDNPLDITEHVGPGNLYVVEYPDPSTSSEPSRIVLLRPDAPPPAGSGEIAIENRDGVPFPDRLVFNRIGGAVSSMPVHEVATLRIHNQHATEPLNITALTLTGPFTLDATITLPATIAAGAFLDVPVRFTATAAGSPVEKRHDGTLTIASSDGNEGSTPVELAGVWQPFQGGPGEATLVEIIDALGYGTTILGPGQSLDGKGHVEAVGDEVLSPYWNRADTSQPVKVKNLAAFHGPGTGTVYWYPEGTESVVGIATHGPDDFQTFFPRLSSNLNLPAEGSFTPGGGTPSFGFRITDQTWSDPTKNQFPGDCAPRCGHQLRFWPVEDRNGVPVPNQYLMTKDFAIGNYDYQDFIYLVSNITPRLDVTAPAIVSRDPAPDADDVPVISSVRVRFSEAVEPTTISPSTVRLTLGAATVPAAISLDPHALQLTIDPTDDLAIGGTYTVTLGPGIEDPAGNPLPTTTWSFTTAAPLGPYRFESGRVVIEAENTDDEFARDGATWQSGSAPAGFVGDSMTITPDVDRGWGDIATAPSVSPQLDYRVDFPAAGTYRVWVRGYAVNGGANSLHVGINGTLTANSDFLNTFTLGSWVWFSASTGGPSPATIAVPSAGVHTVNVWGREDGFSLDRMVIATSGTTPTGTGPPESPRAPASGDVEPPTVVARDPAPSAANVPRDESVEVTFSEALDPASVTGTSAQLTQEGATTPVAATLALSAGDTVLTIDPTADLAASTTYTVSLGSGIRDVAGNVLAPVSWTFTTAGFAGPYQFASGQVVIEAEHADGVLPRSGATWRPDVAPPGSVAGAMTFRPDTGQGFDPPNVTAASPQLDVQVEFPAAGSYRVWVRANAPNTSGNSLHLGVDGPLPATSDNLSTATFGAWVWLSGSAGGPNPATIAVASAGVHTVNVWGREDGLALDRIVIATAGATPTGDGPPESLRSVP